MTVRQSTYLVLSVLGLVVPWYHNVAFARESSLEPSAFLAAVFVNHASASIGWDITIACAAFLVFVFAESKRLGLKHPWVFVAIAVGVAFACAAPLFLFVRDRKLEAR